MWLSLAAVVLGAGPGAETAEAQFKKMEQQVLKCKTLQTDLDLVGGTETESFMAMKGRMLVTRGNKLRMELEGEMRKEKDKLVMVSDGTKMSMTSSKLPGKEQDTEKHMTEVSLASFSRAGIVASLFLARLVGPDDKPKAFEIDKNMAVSDFKLGKKEAVGDKEAQAIDYKLTLKGGKEAMAVTVWVDVKTNLPVKRVVISTEDKMTITVTEKYTKTVLDGKIDEKEFALPK